MSFEFDNQYKYYLAELGFKLCGIGDAVKESYTYGNNYRTITVKDGKGNDYLYNYDYYYFGNINV